jgi:hypothetical protein
MVKRALTIVVLVVALNAYAQVQPINATIDAGRPGAPISKRIYGQFMVWELVYTAIGSNSGLFKKQAEGRTR